MHYHRQTFHMVSTLTEDCCGGDMVTVVAAEVDLASEELLAEDGFMDFSLARF